MKYLKYILLLAVLLSCKAEAQKIIGKSSIQFYSFTIENGVDTSKMIFNFTDSTIHIKGDTTRLLWFVFKCYDDLLKKYKGCEENKDEILTMVEKFLDARQAHIDTMVITPIKSKWLNIEKATDSTWTPKIKRHD